MNINSVNNEENIRIAVACDNKTLQLFTLTGQKVNIFLFMLVICEILSMAVSFFLHCF